MRISFITFIVALAYNFQIGVLAQNAKNSETNVLAENLVSKSFFNQKSSKGFNEVTIEKLDSIVYHGITLGYFYQYQPSGYALIPKFRELNPYFAFSSNGRLDINSDIFISSFLKEELILRYCALKENKLTKESITKNNHEWEVYLSKGFEGEYPVQIPAAGTTSTGGLIETQWGQTGIYDDFCPVDPITNLQCVTGCTPTAMAQIVNYWGNLTGIPNTVSFSFSDNYTSNYDPGDGNGERIIEIDATTASFSNITYPLTDQNIGRLNFACGVSLKAAYSSSGTGAFPSFESFINKFGFQSARELTFGIGFTDVLYHNIENGMPSLLAIGKPNVGHSIVCDGFIDDGTTIRFHLNYGWDGAYAEPTLFYEIPSNLPADFTSIGGGIVDITNRAGICDNDGNFYKTVKIGTQIWMAENLKTTKYNDGTEITLVTSNTSWAALTTPGYCWYKNDDTINRSIYGALYNWYTINTDKLCPAGWHIPTNEEWNILSNYLGGESVAGSKLKETGNLNWLSPNAGSTNESGFTALPGGHRNRDGVDNYIGAYGYWWSAEEIDRKSVWSRILSYNDRRLNLGSSYKQNGFSVRCLKGEIQVLPVLTSTFVTSQTCNTATSGGNVTDGGGSPVIVRGVCWNTEEYPTIMNSKTSDGTGTGIFVSSITGLTAKTTYYLRAYATNSTGTSYGEQKKFITLNSGITTVIDIEGNEYNTIAIGTQVWLVGNLKTTKYNDGTGIPLVPDNFEWAALTTPGFCWYNNDSAEYKSAYGALYNWYSVNTGKLCPINWRVPTDAEWTILTTYLGGINIAGGRLKETGNTHWQSPNTGATNESRFTALPGGVRSSDGGYFYNGITGLWWSATETDVLTAWSRFLDNDNECVIINTSYKQNGGYVRCIQDRIVTSIDNIKTDEISVFPNPVSSILNIVYMNDNYRAINILNLKGGLMAKEKAASTRQQLDFSGFKPGLYILEFSKGSGEILRVKVIKNK